jgi:hypothetical protein
MSRVISLSAALALSLCLARPASAAGPGVTVVREAAVSVAPTSSSSRTREPIVAAHPTDPLRIAAVYPRGDKSPKDIISISHDGGKTFRTAAGDPSGGGNHPVITWGKGPAAGSARLYYMALTTAGGACCVLAISHSDNEGRTWSAPFIARGTGTWFGGFPELATDNNPASPNYGTVYAAYNWPANPTKGPGLRLLASSNYGRTFHGIEVPVAKTPAGYGDTWRIDYRIDAAPDGSAYVAFYQRDVRSWNISSPFSLGGLSNVGRIGFSVAHFTYHRATGTFSLGRTVMAAKLPKTSWNIGAGSPVTGMTDPMWNFGFDVDPTSGTVYMAVGVDGGVRVYRSLDNGSTWTYRTVPAPAAVSGRSQYTFHPQVVAGVGFVLVTLHSLDRSGSSRSVGNDYAVSFDQGRTFSRPKAISASRWRTGYFSGVYNGIGLRERAVLTADGHVFFAYGDGRMSAGGHYGFGRIYGALFAITAPEPAPVPTPEPSPVPTPEPSPVPTPEPSPVPTPEPSPSPAP